MDHYWYALVLGVVEGLTEFLPISSTAHLRIVEALLGIDLSSGYWKMFTIVIQLGAILCVPIYFRQRIGEFLSTFPKGIRGDRTPLNHPLTLTLVAFACTAAPSFLMSKMIGRNLESLVIMGVALVAGGILMWVIDGIWGEANQSGDVDTISLKQAVSVGLCQTLSAVFPGTSRSMATIAAGELAGMSRRAALEFSFLLSIPTMAAATVYDLVKSIVRPDDAGTGALTLELHSLVVLGVGFVVSFFVAWGVVAWFMRWVRRRGFAAFAVYRILVGIAVLVWAWR